MEIVKLPKMDEQEIQVLMQTESICRIAFMDGEFPYIAPFQYVFLHNSLYFHITDYGKKREIIAQNNHVCVSIEKLKPDLSEYRFLCIRGKLEPITDPAERSEVIRKFAAQAKKKFSTAFLSAHGFEKQKGWDILTETQPLLIFKLTPIGDPIGLKSL
jgi:nitroimidazol reductase NimA-like FMN-containing flavoprotein (pyridoxamine 5'-phosphate oxidase superfamily)